MDIFSLFLYFGIHKDKTHLGMNKDEKKSLDIFLTFYSLLSIPSVHSSFQYVSLDSSYVAASAYLPASGTILFFSLLGLVPFFHSYLLASTSGKLFYILQNYNRSTAPVLVSYNTYDNSTDAVDLNIGTFTEIILTFN